MKIRAVLGAATVAVLATFTGLGAIGASAAPDTPAAPGLSDSQVGQGAQVMVRGDCPAPHRPGDYADINVDGLISEPDIALDGSGHYAASLSTDTLTTGEHDVTVTCNGYAGTAESAAATLTIDPAIESSIQIVDNNGGDLNTGDPVTLIATQIFNAPQDAGYGFYVQSNADIALTDDQPKIKSADAGGTFWDPQESFSQESNSYGPRWNVTVGAKIPADTTLSVEANGTLTAEAGSTITITDGRTGEVREVTVGQAAELTLVATPNEGSAGITVTLDATGLQADTAYEIYFHSVPVQVGSVTSDADGTAHTMFTVPADAVEGAHTVSLTLNGQVIVSAPFHVTAAAATPAPTTPEQSATWVPEQPAPGDDGGELAETGFEVAPLGATAAGMILLGGLVLLLSRRSNGERQH